MHLCSQSFAVFVYPFSFARESFEALVAAVDQDQLVGDAAAWPVWGRRPFPHDDLLRHVADYLNPPAGVPPTACLWTLDERVFGSPKGLGLRPGVLSLGLRHRRAGVAPPDAGEVPSWALGLDAGGVDLVLSRVGMGYLLLRLRPRSQVLEDWLDFLNGFRYLERPGETDLLFHRRTGKERLEPYYPPLAAPAADPARAGAGLVLAMDLIRGLLRRLAPGAGDWWREVFVPGQVLPFHGLFLAGSGRDDDALTLYRLRQFFRAGQAPVPAADDLRPDHPALLPYANRMWFTLGLEGGGFVAFDAPETPFWTTTMPQHLEEQYLLLFLIALHQRFTLMHLSDQVSAGWLGADEAQSEAWFSDLREVLLEFTARGYFTQVMQREHHHRCFRAWQQVFETDRIYREVSDEVRELHSMLLMRKTERIQRLAEEQRQFLDAQARAQAERDRAIQARSDRLASVLGVIAALFGPPSLTLAFLQLIGMTSGRQAIPWLIGSFLFGGLLMLILHQFIKRSGAGAVASQPQRPHHGDTPAPDSAPNPSGR